MFQGARVGPWDLKSWYVEFRDQLLPVVTRYGRSKSEILDFLEN